MEDFRRTKTTVSLLNYHFVFCPRYRRRIFLNEQVDLRFKELVQQICEKEDVKILAMETDKDLHRKIVVKRKQSHKILTNYVLSLGSDIREETISVQGLQKRAMKTTRNRKNGRSHTRIRRRSNSLFPGINGLNHSIKIIKSRY